MLTIQDKLILKRKVYLQNGVQATKTYKLLRYRHKSQSTQIYDVYDSQLTRELTLKIMIKNQQLSKQKSINQIKNQQLFVGLPNFISLYDIYQDNQKIYLVMEKWGDTLVDLANERIAITEYQAQLIFSQLVDIIVELRKRNIAHNFITLESLYIDIKEKHKIKLGDFKKSFNVASYFENILPENRKLSSNDIEKVQKKVKQQHPMLLILQPKDINEKITSYSSPQEVSSSNSSQDYSKFLCNLYENDVWNIGIILYRLLMGRFPFNDEENEDIKYAFEIFANKKEFESINKKQCCFNFHEKGDIYCEPISVQMKELIKSILKPVDRRIRLKDLLNHPLKLKSYHNITDINFQHHLPPLLSSNILQYPPLKPIRSYLFDNYLLSRQIQQIQEEENRWSPNPKLMESNTNNFFHSSQSSKRNFQDLSDLNRSKSYKKYTSDDNIKLQENFKNLHFLSPKANFSLFSIFNNEEQSNFSIGNSHNHQANQKYSYTWNINFANSSEITTEDSIQEGISQFQPLSTEKDKRSQLEFNSRKLISDKEKLSNSNSGNTSKRIKLTENFDQQTEQNDRNFQQTEKQNNGIRKFMHKRVPSASIHKRELMKSVYNTGNYEPISSLIKTSSNQFNIRNINSKKNIVHSTLFSLAERKVTAGKSDKNFGNSSIPEESGNFEVKSLSNSRIISAKGYQFINNLDSFKSNLMKYQERQDQICESEEVADSMTAPIDSQKKQNLLHNEMFRQREAQHLILKNHVEQLPLLVQEPEFVMQYKFKKQENSLGYVLNNGVGVIFENGKQIIGHNENDFVILQKYSNLNQSKQNYSYQMEKVNRQLSDRKSLTPSENQIYHNFLKLFGKRMVISNFSIWIQRFWRIGRVFIFLFNNGSWQVTLQGKKTSKFFIIDENHFIWTKGNINPEVLNKIRQIVNQKRQQIMEEQYFFK